MTDPHIISPPRRTYRGDATDPARWALYRPRRGDVIVCTPAKSGTTWTQTIIAMLLNGGPDLPDRVTTLSPWIEMNVNDGAAMAAALEAQPGRRVVKSHSPSDGFPVWDGVHLVTVFRHPLDMFLSLRNHAFNMVRNDDTHPMRQALSVSLHTFLNRPFDPDNVDADGLPLLAHMLKVAAEDRWPGALRLHYADMLRDPRGAVAGLARGLEIPADDALIDAVTRATTLKAMRDKADLMAPETGKGYWHDDRAFFHSGGTGKWQGRLGPDDLAAYEARRDALLTPDLATWLEQGTGGSVN